MNTKPGEVYTVPISHGEGRFLASQELVQQLADNGQIATQYVDLAGNPTADIHFNPNNSVWPSRASPLPTGGSWVRWATANAPAPACIRTSPVTMT